MENEKRWYEFVIDELFPKEKIEYIKRKLEKTLNDSFEVLHKSNILKWFEVNKEKPNCLDCVHWNYGRMYWICNKNHGIMSESKDRTIRCRIDKKLLPFLETNAKVGCPDYKYNDKIRNFDHMTLKYEDVIMNGK